MIAYKLRGKILSGQKPIIKNQRLVGWRGSLHQWQTAKQYEEFVLSLDQLHDAVIKL